MVNKNIHLVLSVAVMATLAKPVASQELGKHVSVVLLRQVGTLTAPPAGVSDLPPSSARLNPDSGDGDVPQHLPHGVAINADNGNMGEQSGGSGPLWDRFDGKPHPSPSPSPSGSKSSSMEAMSFAHFDDGSDTPRVVDRPNLQPGTSGTYVSSIGSGANAVIKRLPASVDMALISVNSKGTVKVLTHNSNSEVVVSKDKTLINEAKGLATTWANQLKEREVKEPTDATYKILVVRSISEIGTAQANSTFPTEQKLSEHLGQVSSDALTKMGSDALSSLSQPGNH